MTEDEITKLAWQYGDTFTSKGGWDAWEIPFGNLLEFAKTIEILTLTNHRAKWYLAGAESEREACVDIIESFGEKESATLEDLVSAIRERGKDD